MRRALAREAPSRVELSAIASAVALTQRAEAPCRRHREPELPKQSRKRVERGVPLAAPWTGIGYSAAKNLEAPTRDVRVSNK